MDNILKRNPCCKFSIKQEEQIIQEYQNGSSMGVLGKKYGCNPSTIQNILKAYQISTRNLSQARRNYLKYTINEDIFENIDTPEKAYWLGVMYADGYITKVKYTNKFGIAVKASDKEWLQKFKNFLGYNGEIKEYLTSKGSYAENFPYVRLLIGNNKIVSDLKKHGVVERKSKILSTLPNIPFLDDFIRGYIDGDGSLAKRLPHIAISGTEDFLTSIANYFNLPYYLYEDKTIYSLQYNTPISRYLEKRLYKNACCYLERKYLIASRSFDSPITLKDVMKNSEYQGKPLET